MHELESWSSFYVITGSSSGALTGLTFIVITLVSSLRSTRDHMREGVATFTTPTIVHFCEALLISATLSAPWKVLGTASIVLALSGLYGIAYAARTILKMAQQPVYEPDVEDWTWYAIVPFIAYAALFLAAIFLTRITQQSLYAIAAVTILLIFVGIRNSWDTVTYVAADNTQDDERNGELPGGS